MKEGFYGNAYALIALATFAWAAAEPEPRCPNNSEALCDVFDATFASVFWPLYWSWEAADHVRSNTP